MLKMRNNRQLLGWEHLLLLLLLAQLTRPHSLKHQYCHTLMVKS
jgi:hypothetical protein